MKGKPLFLLTAVAAILIGFAILSMMRQARTTGTAIGGKILPGLAVNDIHSVEISDSSNTVTVAKVDGIWRVSSHHNYPADFGKVRELLTKLADLNALQSIRATIPQRRELHLQPGAGTSAGEQPGVINLKDVAGRSAATLLLGKERFRPDSTPDAGPYGNFPDGRFVATTQGSIFLVGDTLEEAVTTPRAWMDDEFVSIKAEDVSTIEVRGTTNGAIVLTRANGKTEFKLPRIPDGKEADAAKLARLASALNYLRYDDIADPASTTATLGLDKPVTFVAKTFKGETCSVTVWKSASPDSRYYARFSVSYTPPDSDGSTTTNQAAKAQVEQNEKLAGETKSLDAKLAPWTYVLNNYAAESFTMGFTDMLKDTEPQEETKKNVNEREGKE